MTAKEFVAKMQELRLKMKDICDRQGIVDPIRRRALIGRPSFLEIVYKEKDDD